MKNITAHALSGNMERFTLSHPLMWEGRVPVPLLHFPGGQSLEGKVLTGLYRQKCTAHRMLVRYEPSLWVESTSEHYIDYMESVLLPR